MNDTVMTEPGAVTSSRSPDSSHSTSSEGKMELDVDEADSVGTAATSLLTGTDYRDTPTSSLTSASALPAVNGLKRKLTSRSESIDGTTVDDNSLFNRLQKAGEFRARLSIPTRLQPAEYAQQCVAAANASRLNPYALHEDENRILRDRLCHGHVTVYLNIRNGILRLWVRNPNVSVNLEEAIGCAKDERWARLACFAYEWLLRRGYINFGCVHAPLTTAPPKSKRRGSLPKTVVVIGGGMAGLSCARQLTSLFQHYPDQASPRITVLEGRGRIGGRIYSHPLSSMTSNKLDPDQRPTAEMGAHIIVGFEHGNPLDPIIRGQLALKHHSLRDLSTLYDINGSPVATDRDTMINRLYNDISERADHYRLKKTAPKVAEGDKELIDAGKDPSDEAQATITIRQYEEAAASGTIDLLLPQKTRRKGAGHKAAKADKPTEEAETNMESKTHMPAAQAAKEFKFQLRPRTSLDENLNLDDLASQLDQSLGAVMNEGVKQYQRLLDLKPFALRLLNWHFANLEYANAANVNRLSLSNWDQDSGNEFEGEHSWVVGGYQQVPRAIYKYPEQLDVRTKKVVSSIRYSTAGRNDKAIVTCEDGDTVEADYVVFSAPLGVLKDQSVQFYPPLPDWKLGAISRMGFGLLNKLVLVFEQPFWDVNRDMFGLLREPKTGSGFSQDDYAARRGQFYLFWNCIETSGLPVLIALMAGDAAFEAERSTDAELVSQCVKQLRNIFGHANVPAPLETIVTRWASDRFARGTYSFVAAGAQPGDYDLLAKSTSNLFFAGEATCGTHPATVHGAYLSGLRAASEVFDSIVGPVAVPESFIPLAAPVPKPQTVDLAQMETHMTQVPKRKGDPIIPAGTFSRPVQEDDVDARYAWDDAMWVRIYNDIGPPPQMPPKLNVNGFLSFQKDHWEEVKADIASKSAGKARAKKSEKAGRDQVRVELGKMWATLNDEGKAKYKDETERNRKENERAFKEWQMKNQEWEKSTWEVKATWEKEGNTFDEFRKRVTQEELMMARKSQLAGNQKHKVK